MTLIPEEILIRLRHNGLFNRERANRGERFMDYKPLVKLFCPWTEAVWLISEVDPFNDDLLFGLCDLGLGSPEIGHVRLSELERVVGPSGERVERDASFRARRSLGNYAEEAHFHGHIIA